MSNKKQKAKAPEWTTAQANYDSTGDVRFAALVLGKWPHNPQAWALKACKEFAKSLDGEVLHAAFAIGMGPDDPPEWAMTACKKLAEKCEVSHDAVLRAHHRGPRSLEMDDDLLEQMADLIVGNINDEVSVHKAALQILGDEGSATNVRRLERKWADEMCGVKDGGDVIETFHPRLDGALLRRYGNKLLSWPEQEHDDPSDLA